MDQEKTAAASNCKSDNSVFIKRKIEKKRVTGEQKKCLMHFIMENPEIITHSTTRECEALLWIDLKTQLNNLKPEKSLYNWKMYSRRLISHLKITPSLFLNVDENKFKRFVLKLLQNVNSKSNEKCIEIDGIEENFFTIKDFMNLEKIELEKTKFKLDIVENKLIIQHLKNLILYFKSENIRKVEKIKRLSANKAHLNKRLQQFYEERKTSDN